MSIFLAATHCTREVLKQWVVADAMVRDLLVVSVNPPVRACAACLGVLLGPVVSRRARRLGTEIECSAAVVLVSGRRSTSPCLGCGPRGGTQSRLASHEGC